MDGSGVEEAVARAALQMPVQAPALGPSGRRVRENKYWRFGPQYGDRAGWIFVGVTARSNPYEWQNLKSLGCEELPDEYGVEPVGGMMSDPGNEGVRFFHILANGGLKEFPASQIVAYGWHLQPEVFRALTPEQRAEVERLEASGVECKFGCWNAREKRVQKFYSRQDLSRHYRVAHGEAVVSESTATAVREALEVALSRMKAADEESWLERGAALLRAYEQLKEAEHAARRKEGT